MVLSCYLLDRHKLELSLEAERMCCRGRRRHLLNSQQLNSKIAGWLVIFSHLLME